MTPKFCRTKHSFDQQLISDANHQSLNFEAESPLYRRMVLNRQMARIERFGIYFDIHRPTGSMRINDVLVLRSYTPAQVRSMVRSAGVWDIVETYDFGYDIDAPIEVDAATEDVVYVLRKK